MTTHGQRETAPVSAIIPCFRCARTIERAVSSVADQSRRPAELLIVDDGSGDGTFEQLNSLAARYPGGWVRIVALPENRGAADARNAGWANAAQPYVAFLDADDAWHPRKIELQHAYMAQHPEVALCAHRHEVRKTPGVPDGPVGHFSANAVSKLSLLLSNNFLAPTMMMVKREIPFRFLSGRRHVDDHLLWLQIVSAGLPFVRLSAVLAFTYKKPYGQSGLSGQTWEMQKAELANYWILHREGSLGLAATLAISTFSIAKFLRRLLIVGLRRG